MGRHGAVTAFINRTNGNLWRVARPQLVHQYRIKLSAQAIRNDRSNRNAATRDRQHKRVCIPKFLQHSK
jgi:hypothetical protein